MKKLYLMMIAILMLAACGNANSASIAGTWSLVSYGLPSSQTPAVPNVDTSIEFSSDGKFTGNVGCNGFGGNYKRDGDKITFSAIMSTLMACQDPIGTQESSVLKSLRDTASFALNGDTLTITSGDGISSVVLARK
jgi:heat shock protein HslJ